MRDEGTVPCNNDLLAENFMLTESGLRLIDYEYSGNNDACFELGNIWSESNLSLAQLEQLVGAYYGRPSRHKVARARLCCPRQMRAPRPIATPTRNIETNHGLTSSATATAAISAQITGR